MYILILPLLIIMGITYAKSRKVYPLMYILSVFTYINTVAYIIDAFDLKKNGIIGILAFSAILMIGIGLFIAQKRKPA